MGTVPVCEFEADWTAKPRPGKLLREAGGRTEPSREPSFPLGALEEPVGVGIEEEAGLTEGEGWSVAGGCVSDLPLMDAGEAEVKRGIRARAWI